MTGFKLQTSRKKKCFLTNKFRKGGIFVIYNMWGKGGGGNYKKKKGYKNKKKKKKKKF